MKCKHKPAVGLAWRTDDMRYASFVRDRRKGLGAAWFGIVCAAPGEPDARWCPACHAWLPLGPATMTPEAEIELRAAEILDARASVTPGAAPIEWIGFEEWLGWDEADVHTAKYPPEWHAGYLAHAILTHTDQSEE